MSLTIKNSFDKKLTFDSLIEAHNRARVGKNTRMELLRFEVDLENNITNIFDSKYYQKLLDSLDKNMKNYLIKRNMSFKEKKLLRFIKENKNDKYKLNAYIVYYGKKKSSSN